MFRSRLTTLALAIAAFGLFHESARAQTPSVSIAFPFYATPTFSSQSSVSIRLTIAAGLQNANQAVTGSITVTAPGNYSRTTIVSGTYDANGNFDHFMAPSTPLFYTSGTGYISSEAFINGLSYTSNTLNCGAVP